MSKEVLFTGQPQPAELVALAETSASPLGEYVLTEMPADLAAVRTGGDDFNHSLRDKQQARLDEVMPVIAGNTDQHTATLTQLDLAFMLGGYLPLGSETYRYAPPQLLSLLDQQADRFRLPARMDYELIIDVNAEEYQRTGHIRTFLDGEDALHERDFYLGHHESEPFIKSVAYQLRSAIENPDQVDVNRTVSIALESMKTFDAYMGAYMRLSTDVFGAMRPYLGSYPDGTRNASGAFMPSVQLAELMLHAPTESQTRYIDESMRYFPRWSQEIMRSWYEDSVRGRNVTDMTLGNELQLSDQGKGSLIGLLNEFLDFRLKHLAATRKQIPAAFEGRDVPVSRRQLAEFGEPDILEEGAIKGTAGFDIIHVLGGAAYRLIANRQQLQEM